MVDFGGWDMPVNYGSQIEEHHAVRREAGVFDVSHMCVIDARGPRVREFLSKLVANDVAKLTTSGKALYSCMLNEQGGVIDDLIVYFLDESFFRIVVNAGTRDKDLAWMRPVAAPFGVELTERTDLAMLAVQGPNARAKVGELLPAGQKASGWQRQPPGLGLKAWPSGSQGDLAIDEVHRRPADEAGDEPVRGPLVEGLRPIRLLDPSPIHDDNPIAQGHRL